MLIPSVSTNHYNVTASAVKAVQPDSAVQKAESVQAAKTPDQDTFVRSSESQKEESAPVETKRLSADQLRDYQDQLNQSFTRMINDIVSNQANQGKKANGKGGLKDFFSDLVVTPEQKLAAQQAIGEDGEWGVNAVATRIMDMCVALSGGDSSKVEEMRAAVDKGFKQAMGDWGGSLPSICSQTHDEINKRFDYWKETGSLDGYQYQKAAAEK
ncbi:MAG: hypothetical protein HFI93_00250 [Lachnospiraceae bacterium]|nr:hypothetical protein [Lachnospiraceae bacterium]